MPRGYVCQEMELKRFRRNKTHVAVNFGGSPNMRKFLAGEAKKLWLKISVTGRECPIEGYSRWYQKFVNSFFKKCWGQVKMSARRRFFFECLRQGWSGLGLWGLEELGFKTSGLFPMGLGRSSKLRSRGRSWPMRCTRKTGVSKGAGLVTKHFPGSYTVRLPSIHSFVDFHLRPIFRNSANGFFSFHKPR